MTAKAALCDYLLQGKVLNVKNCFTIIGLTNAAREVSRMIEAPFKVTLVRTKKEGKSRYGQDVYWFDYQLKPTTENKEGIQKMKEYLATQKTEESIPVITVREHTRNSTKNFIPPNQEKLF